MGRKKPWARVRIWRVLLLLVIVLVLLAAGAAYLVRGPFASGVEERPVNAPVSEERIRETVDVLCNRFFPRNYRHPEILDQAAEWIAQRFRDAGLPVSFQEYTLAEGTYRNVVARREGSDPAAGVTVLGAHYDAYSDLPGADDNASAVAALLELAATLPVQVPERTLYLVAFCTEEPPFFGSEDMGSFRFARKLRDDGIEVDLMVSIEMVGYFTDEPGSQRFPLPGLGLLYPNRGDFLAVVGDLTSGQAIRTVKTRMRSAGEIPVYSFRGPAAVPGIDWSDHWGFRRLGMPAVMVTDTAFMRNPNYHTDGDTPDTLDYPRMVKVVRSLHGIVREP
jgi:hypothetical protein